MKMLTSDEKKKAILMSSSKKVNMDFDNMDLVLDLYLELVGLGKDIKCIWTWVLDLFTFGPRWCTLILDMSIGPSCEGGWVISEGY